jgi:hypothetical protein
MMACRTGKRRYPTEEAARIKLALMDQDSPTRHELRVYLCEFCCGWHMTRQPPADPLARRRRRT